MFNPLVKAWIWKVVEWGRWGFSFSKSNVICLASKGSRAPMVENDVICCTGQLWITFKVDIVHGTWAKYLTMPYFLLVGELGLYIDCFNTRFWRSGIMSFIGFSVCRWFDISKVETFCPWIQTQVHHNYKIWSKHWLFTCIYWHSISSPYEEAP